MPGCPARAGVSEGGGPVWILVRETTHTQSNIQVIKYVVKHKSAKLFMTYAVRKVRGSSQYKPFNIKYKQSET